MRHLSSQLRKSSSMSVTPVPVLWNSSFHLFEVSYWAQLLSLYCSGLYVLITNSHPIAVDILCLSPSVEHDRSGLIQALRKGTWKICPLLTRVYREETLWKGMALWGLCWLIITIVTHSIYIRHSVLSMEVPSYPSLCQFLYIDSVCVFNFCLYPV